MNKSIFIIVCVTLLLGALNWGNQLPLADKEYETWKVDFGMNFNQVQEPFRRAIFMKNYAEIAEHNENPEKSYEMGLNQFSHLTDSQFSALMGVSTHREINDVISSIPVEGVEAGEIDWEQKGKVSPVGNQGSCDAGYAFCTGSYFESYILMNGQGVLLSKQQYVDCGSDYTMFGCNSGSRTGALNYTFDKGLASEKNYPWTGKVGTCQLKSGEYKFNFKVTEAIGCDQLRTGIMRSPMTVAVNIEGWKSYKSGIMDSCGDQVSHDIFLVGATDAYWRLKNSWGTAWGERGFIRVKAGNTCGVCSKPGYGF